VASDSADAMAYSLWAASMQSPPATQNTHFDYAVVEDRILETIANQPDLQVTRDYMDYANRPTVRADLRQPYIIRRPNIMPSRRLPSYDEILLEELIRQHQKEKYPCPQPQPIYQSR
jgi:hypothetical protein